jgi:hypothetical protein
VFELILANVSINLKFFRRNRLVLAMGLVFVAVTLIYTTGSLMFGSTAGHFEAVTAIFMQLSYFTSLFTAGLGLFLVSAHVRGRSIKLVVTKPCTPDVWLASAFLSAMGVAFALHMATLIVAVGLSWAWGILMQGGFAFVAISSFVRSAIMLGYLVMLTMLFHPVVAVLCAVVFTESTFYAIRFEALAAIKATGGNLLLPLLEKASYLIYMILPMTVPYEREQGDIFQTFRVSGAQWLTCFYSIVYAATLTIVFYFISLRLLRRKNLM